PTHIFTLSLHDALPICTHPVLPGEQRSQGDIPCTNQIRIEREMTVLTHEDQPLVWAIVRRSIPTFGTRLTGMVGIDFDSHTSVQAGFVGNIAMQLCKRPLGGM